MDTERVGSAEIMTQPGNSALTRDGLWGGRNSFSAVSPSHAPPFEFTDGSIDRVIVDVSGDGYLTTRRQRKAGCCATGAVGITVAHDGTRCGRSSASRIAHVRAVRTDSRRGVGSALDPGGIR